MLLSTARMLAPEVGANALLHVLHGVGRRACDEQGIVDVLGGVRGGSTDDDIITLNAPFNLGTWGQAQLLSNGGRDRHLSLGRDLGFNAFQQFGSKSITGVIVIVLPR